MVLWVAMLLSLICIVGLIFSIKTAIKTKSPIAIAVTILLSLLLIAFLAYIGLTVLFVNSID